VGEVCGPTGQDPPDGSGLGQSGSGVPGARWKAPFNGGSIDDTALAEPPRCTRAIAVGGAGRSAANRAPDVDGRALQANSCGRPRSSITMIKQSTSSPRKCARGARGRTEGKLGGQAPVIEVTGRLEGPDESVNSMASTYAQVRNIAEWTIAVATATCRRDHGRRYAARFLQLKEAITRWSNQLRSFASSDARRRARSAPTEARRQAIVPGVAGTWKA